MPIDINAILQSDAIQKAITDVLLAVVTGVAGLISKSVYTWIHTHTNATQFALLQELVTDAVQAAEQGAIGGFVTDKKVAALNYATDYLAKAGLKIDPDQLSSAIEAAVLREFNSAGQDSTDTTNAPVVDTKTAPVPDAAVDESADAVDAVPDAVPDPQPENIPDAQPDTTEDVVPDVDTA